jgi:beta-N-acetylhexosaminidase
MKTTNRFLIYLLTLTILFSGLGAVTTQGQSATPTSAPPAQADLDAQVEAILEQLSVEERVGQLFMVSMVGQNAYPADAISQLILEYKIGGVYLKEANNNVSNTSDDTPAQVANLTNQLQTGAYKATHHQATGLAGQPSGDFFLPLFTAIDHEGDGFPNTHLRNGFTPIPSAMALGATWSPDDVEAVGAIIGQELAAVGINMLLGPVVDVLEKPRPEGSGDINIRAFGGSPYWVGQMGRAYIRGVHRGGAGRVLTVAKHFPGHGASDRSPDLEVATVQKSLAQLQQSDLVPFFAVTRPDPEDPLGVTDGMMPSHIRYRGFQGDVNQLTRPISLDREGMEAFMALPPLDQWRAEGLIVCDSLGVRAVKSYYDPTFQTFPAKQIAKEALMAGNDVLPLDQFAPLSNPDWFEGQRPTIEETIVYFQEQYLADELFRQRTDEAVRHILRAKLRLYPKLTLDEVLVTGDEPVGQGEATVAQVARKSLTLLYPPADDLPLRLPAPPRSDEDILIMGCFEGCLARTRIYSDTVRDTLLGLYGPGGSDLLDPARVHTLGFLELYQLMTGEADVSEEETSDDIKTMIEQIQNADWLVLILVNYIPDNYPESGVARLFLRDPSVIVNGEKIRFDLRDKKIVALALHAPYYLDATEIGKLSAYYAVYSKIEPSLKVALQALFQEITPTSASPVSVEGIGYDLGIALRPAPGQTLALKLDPSANAAWHVGDLVRVRVGPVLDFNGHPVPDGTQVFFQSHYTDLDINLPPQQITDTVNGFAWAVFQPAVVGQLEISANADGLKFEPLGLRVNAEAITPATQTTTGEPQLSPTTTAMASTSPVSPATPLPTAQATPAPPGPSSPPAATWLAIVLGTLLVFAALALLWWRSRAGLPAATSPPGSGAAEETSTVSADLGDLSPALTGRTLGSCQVGQKLGQGGMGQVYKGHHPMLDRSVAIKILPPALVQSGEMRARFLQEARIAAALRHPNIVQIYDFGQDKDLLYMIMEYVDGTSLKARLAALLAAGETMPGAEAIRIARQIAGALTYAHAQNAVHRDLKPANILLTQEGQAILVDFGLAVLRGGPRYTQPGKVWGSPTYIAPEQLDEKPRVDARSDIYALGVMCYEMVTGQPPFQAQSVLEVLWQKANLTPRSPRELAPDLPLALEAIIVKALAKNPDKRFQTAQEMAEELWEVDGGQ